MLDYPRQKNRVIPANAGIQTSMAEGVEMTSKVLNTELKTMALSAAVATWIPAFAGMTRS